MRRAGFLEGVGVALVASLFAGVLFTALAPLVGGGTALRALVGLLGLGYVLYLLRRAPERVGRVTAVTCWAVLAALLWWLTPPLAAYALAHAALAWLVRALYFHAGPLPALADLGLAGFGVAAGVAALAHTGSVALAVWCFFLVQALFPALPRDLAAAEGAAPADAADRFQQAHRAAEAAVRSLSTPR